MNQPQVTLSYLLGPGTFVPTCAGGFILLGLDMAGHLVGGPWLQEGGSLGMLWSPVSGEGEEDGPIQDRAGTHSCLTSYLML